MPASNDRQPPTLDGGQAGELELARRKLQQQLRDVAACKLDLHSSISAEELRVAELEELARLQQRLRDEEAGVLGLQQKLAELKRRAEKLERELAWNNAHSAESTLRGQRNRAMVSAAVDLERLQQSALQ